MGGLSPPPSWWPTPTVPSSPPTTPRCTLPRLLTLPPEALSTLSTPLAMLLPTLTSEALLDTPTVPLSPLTLRRCTLLRLPTLPAVPSTMLPSPPTPTLPAILTPTTTALSPCTLASLDLSPTPTAPLSQLSPLMWSPPGPSTLQLTLREPSSLLETIY